MRRFFAVLLAAGLVLGACGGDSGGGPDPADDPKGALTNALTNLSDGGGSQVTLSVDSTTDDLVALAAGDLTEEQADMILNSSMMFKGNQAQTMEDAEFEFVLDIDGSLAEFRIVGGVFYARADVSDLVEKFGGSQEELDAAAAQAGAQFDFVQPLIDGDWVGFEGFQQLLEQAAGGSIPSPDPQLQKKFVEDIAKAVTDSSTVTEEGTDDVGTHLVADVNIKELYGAMVDSFASFSQMPGAELPSDTEVPDQDIKIDFWVDDGSLSQIAFDFVQLKDIEGAEDFPEGVDEFSMVMEIDEFDDSVDAPDAATTVDLQELMGGLMGGLGGLDGTDSGTDTGGGTEDICETLKDSPAEVQEQFADQCPEFAQ